MQNRTAVHAPVRLVVAVAGVVVAAYAGYTVLTATFVNAALTAAGALPAYSTNWMAQTALGSLFGLFAAFLAVRSAYRPGVLTLAGFLLAQGFATGYLNSIAFAGVGGQTWYVARALVNWMSYALALRTTQLFPRTLDPRRLRRRPFGFVNILVGARRVWVGCAVLLGISLAAESDVAFQLGQLLVLTVAVATMAANYREGSPDERRKIYWLLLGGACLFVARVFLVAGRAVLELIGSSGSQLATIYGVLRTISWTLANAGLLSCLMLAVFYEGAVDPRLVIRRTAVYSFAIGLAVFGFAVFENYVVEVVAAAVGIEEGILEAAGGAAIALLLKPLHKVLSRFTEAALPKTGVTSASTADSLSRSGASGS